MLTYVEDVLGAPGSLPGMMVVGMVVLTVFLIVACIAGIAYFNHRSSVGRGQGQGQGQNQGQNQSQGQGQNQNQGQDNRAFCPVVFGPSAVAKRRQGDMKMLDGDVCLSLGRHMDLTRRLTFRPRYIRVAAGYGLIAFARKNFGEPVRYKIRGPEDRSIQVDSYAYPIQSAVVYLALRGRTPDILPCHALLRRRLNQPDASAACVQVGAKGKWKDPVARADVQPGFRMIAYPHSNLVGTPVTDVVGPGAYRRQRGDAPVLSFQVHACPLTLYPYRISRSSGESNRIGKPRCVSESLPELPFQPTSVFLGDGHSMQVFSHKNFGGRMLLSATGPRAISGPSRQRWGSIKIVNNRRTPCVTLYRRDAVDAETGETLAPGVYTQFHTRYFQPFRASVPFGASLQAFDRTGTLILDRRGPFAGSVSDAKGAWELVITR